MFLLFGMRPVAVVAFVVTFVCGRCGTEAAQQVLREQQKVTLFFIPLFSLSTSWAVECGHCGAVTALTREQAAHSVEWARTHGLVTA